MFNSSTTHVSPLAQSFRKLDVSLSRSGLTRCFIALLIDYAPYYGCSRTDGNQSFIPLSYSYEYAAFAEYLDVAVANTDQFACFFTLSPTYVRKFCYNMNTGAYDSVTSIITGTVIAPPLTAAVLDPGYACIIARVGIEMVMSCQNNYTYLLDQVGFDQLPLGSAIPNGIDPVLELNTEEGKPYVCYSVAVSSSSNSSIPNRVITGCTDTNWAPAPPLYVTSMAPGFNVILHRLLTDSNGVTCRFIAWNETVSNLNFELHCTRNFMSAPTFQFTTVDSGQENSNCKINFEMTQVGYGALKSTRLFIHRCTSVLAFEQLVVSLDSILSLQRTSAEVIISFPTSTSIVASDDLMIGQNRFEFNPSTSQLIPLEFVDYLGAEVNPMTRSLVPLELPFQLGCPNLTIQPPIQPPSDH